MTKMHQKISKDYNFAKVGSEILKWLNYSNKNFFNFAEIAKFRRIWAHWWVGMFMR